jgi:hypothetical protein
MGRWNRTTGRLFVAAGGFGLALAFQAGAAPMLSGDVSGDGALGISDIVLLVNQLNSGTPVTGMDLVLADANQDGPFDAADVDYVANVILGLAAPKPIGGGSVAESAVSFWALEGAPKTSTEENVLLVAAPAFWVVEPAPSQVSSENAVMRANPSFWAVAPAPTQISSENAILRANPSFEVQE